MTVTEFGNLVPVKLPVVEFSIGHDSILPEVKTVGTVPLIVVALIVVFNVGRGGIVDSVIGREMEAVPKTVETKTVPSVETMMVEFGSGKGTKLCEVKEGIDEEIGDITITLDSVEDVPSVFHVAVAV